MSYPTVNRRLPIINGFVPVPDDQVEHPTTLTPEEVIDLIPGSAIITIGDTQKGSTQYVELPEYVFAAPEDWYAILRAAAE
jgi:hypothetical protein